MIKSENLDNLKNDPTLKKILDDSYGGVCYMKKPSDYDSTELMKKWDLLTPTEKDCCDGCVTGAINFIKGC